MSGNGGYVYKITEADVACELLMQLEERKRKCLFQRFCILRVTQTPL